MAIQIVCPNCQTTYNLAEEQSGKRVRCKKCETIFTAELPQAKPDVPSEELPAPSRPEPVDQEGVARRRPQPRAATPARRRDRYADDDQEDFRTSRPRARKRRSSHLGLFLIVGGVIASLVMVIGCAVLALWLFTREQTRNAGTQVAFDGPRVLPVPPAGNGNGANGDIDEDKGEAPKEANVKEPDPPSPEPKEPDFISPVPADIAPANPRGPAKAELDPEVVQKVKGATVYLRVTMPDGNIAQGSGFFGAVPAQAERNIILTNAHVVGMLWPDSGKPKSIEAVRNKGTQEEKKFAAELLGLDRSSDLAVLRVSGNDTPPPLEVKSAGSLRETQRVWVAGFPFGERPGREISLSDSSVSSLRRDDNGMLTRLQVNGGMERGNSGGPVVDAYGNVIGVSVSILGGTKLNFAVPGDSVRKMIHGRIAGLTLGQPFVKDGQIRVPATLRLIDPLKRIHSPALEVWTGEPSKRSRPPETAQPATQSGDSPHDRQSLVLRGEEAQAEIALPPLPPGKVYWIQPQWLGTENKPHWASAHSYDLAAPVELRPALLVLKHETGSRDAVLNTWNNVRLSDPARGEHEWSVTTETHLTETTEAIDKQESANVRMSYRSYNMAVKVDNQMLPADKNLRRIRHDIRSLRATVQLDKNGNPGEHEIDVTQVPQASRNELNGLFAGLQHALDGLTVPLPNKQVVPGETWKGERALPLYYHQGYQTETAGLDMTYTYLGTRQQNGRNEAVVALKGQLQKGAASLELAGRAEGIAVVDLANGQVTQASVIAHFDADASQTGGYKSHGTSHVRLRRPPPGARG
jgi:predicted Zn finger-like uncharacterized protein